MPMLLTIAESSGHGAQSLVLDMLVVLGAAALISVFLRRLHLASIPGYLIIGAVIGSMPSSFRLIQSPDNVNQIASIAIILLMFTIGLHLDVGAIRSGMVPILIVGAASTVGSMLLIWPIIMIFRVGAPAALAIAMGLSMSSTAVVLGILQTRKEIHLMHGRLCIGISIMQDLISIAVLALLPAISIWAAGAGGGGGKKKNAHDAVAHAAAETPRALELVASGSLAVGGILAMLAFARFLLPKLLTEASRDGNTEALLVASAGAGLSAAVLTAALGFGPALGAFLAGFMLSATPFRYQLAGQLSPMRDLFMAVFFTAVGLKLDVTVAFPYWWVILLGVALVMLVKAGLIGLSTWAGGATAGVAVMTGGLLAQAGEFSLVVLDQAHDQKIINDTTNVIVIAMVVLSLILTIPFADMARSLAPRLTHIRPARWIASPALRDHGARHPHSAHPSQPAGGAPTSAAAATVGDDGLPSVPVAPASPSHREVVIAGFGVVGRNLAEHFAARGIPFTVVELNPTTVVRQQRLGRRTVFGDVSTPDVLESAGIMEAEAVVLTIPDDEATLRAIRAIRTLRPDIYIAARTSYLSRAIAAHEVGADHVTIEEVVTAQDMAVRVIEELNKRLARIGAEAPHL